MHTPGNWGSWTHDAPRTSQPEEPHNNVYDMYPMDWAAASDEQREREESRQRRSRENNDGMGFVSDYGEDYRTTHVEMASRPLGAMAALKTFESGQ